MLLVRNDLGTPYPIKLINPDTGNLKFKFEILQGGENFQDESNNHNQGKIGGLTFLFLFTALIGLCNRYSRPSTNHTFFISDLVWLRIIRKVYLHLTFLFKYPDVFSRQSCKRNHFCYFISIYAKLFLCISFNRKWIRVIPTVHIPDRTHTRPKP